MPPGVSLVWLSASADPGFDIGLVNAMKSAVSIPVIASSGAGSAQHFVECFEQTPVEAALAVRLPPSPRPPPERAGCWCGARLRLMRGWQAGIFHRQEVPISEVKTTLIESGIPQRESGV